MDILVICQNVAALVRTYVQHLAQQTCDHCILLSGGNTNRGVGIAIFFRAFLTAKCSVARTVLLVSLQALSTMLAIYIPAAPGCAEERAKSKPVSLGGGRKSCNVRTDEETNFECFFSCLFPTSMFVEVDVFVIFF